jgi:methyl-accepting chemotaxis protein
MISANASELQNFQKEAVKTGNVMSAQTAKKLEAFQKSVNNLKDVFGGLKNQLISALLPTMNTFVDRLKGALNWIKENKDQIKEWGKNLALAAGIFLGGKGIISVIKMATGSIRLFRAGFRGLNATMKANIFIAVASLVAVLVRKIIKAYKESAKFRATVKFVWESIKYYFNLAKDFIVFVAKSWWTAAKTYFKAIADFAGVVWDSVKAIFQKGKSPADVFKEGFDNVKSDIADAAKDIGDDWKKNFQNRSKPSYDAILNKEKAKQKAKEAGEGAGEDYKTAFNNQVSDGIGENMQLEKMNTTFSQLPTKINATTDSLAQMNNITRQSRNLTFNLSNLMSNAFQGMQNVITNAFKNGENVLKGFGKFFVDFAKGLIAKLVAIATISAIVAAVIGSFPGIGGGALGVHDSMKFGELFKGGLNTFGGNMFSFADGAVVEGRTIAEIGEYSGVQNNPEVVAPLDKLQSLIKPQGMSGNVRFELEGDKLVGVIDNTNMKDNTF